MSAPAGRQQVTEPRLRVLFRNWLADLDDDQVAALAENWDNVMNDAALDRVDSWVIAAVTLARLREPHGPGEPDADDFDTERAEARTGPRDPDDYAGGEVCS